LELARKVRRHLLPLLFVLYAVAYLDRINVGFAALDVNRELGLSREHSILLLAQKLYPRPAVLA
jgi:hypothetical protein